MASRSPPSSTCVTSKGSCSTRCSTRSSALRGAAVAAVDSITRFYILWRFTYRESAIEAGDVYVFCYPQGIEIDGPAGLTGQRPEARREIRQQVPCATTSERGDDETLGLAANGKGRAAGRRAASAAPPPRRAAGRGSRVSRSSPTERRTASTGDAGLVGPGARADRKRRMHSPTAELGALARLNANWRSIVEGAAYAHEVKSLAPGRQDLFSGDESLMSTHSRPWLQCVELHPDVLSDDFSEDIFALDLGTLSDYLIGKEQRAAGRGARARPGGCTATPTASSLRPT